MVLLAKWNANRMASAKDLTKNLLESVREACEAALKEDFIQDDLRFQVGELKCRIEDDLRRLKMVDYHTFGQFSESVLEAIYTSIP
jgi:hypothetical protein